MFSTNLPTETLYKTSFTLGVIILVFTITYRLKLSFDLENLKHEMIKESYVSESNFSIKFGDFFDTKQNITRIKKTLKDYDSILNYEELDNKTLELIYKHKSLKIDSLKIYRSKFKLLKEELENDGVLNLFDEKKSMLEYEKYESFVNRQSTILFIISILMIFLGLFFWRRVQIISDQTAKFNLEKIKLEVENLKLSQKRYIVNKPLSENEECNND
jgi:hypothetical protein